MKYEELTHKIIGCAMEVHKFLGEWFSEPAPIIRRSDSFALGVALVKKL